jgi:NhaP-type Na+/H+ or K+/H+ antiporter
MLFETWALIVGALLITMALAGSLLRRLPLSTAMLYLGVGAALGPAGLELLEPDPAAQSQVLERATELAVLISLFAIGLKLGLPFTDPRWRIALRLASISMLVTIALVAILAYWILGLPVGAAILLGAILAPTDPVLASDVQVTAADDRDRLRFSLSAEGGLNDGAAFPFVMLGLGLLGLHDLGGGGWRWLVVDVLWAISAGLVIGALCGAAIGRLVLHLRTQHRLSVGLDEFLALGLIALVYALAVFAHTYGFLAVLAAGIALQRVQRQSGSAGPPPARHTIEPDADTATIATDERYAGAFLMREVGDFNEQLERIAELAIVVVLGAMLHYVEFDWSVAWLVPALLLVVRPISICVGLAGAPVPRGQRLLMSWFGIRGIGSIYYVMYAANHGLPDHLAGQLTTATLTLVAASIVLHGISVTPLMDWYARTSEAKRPPPD